MAEKSSPSPRIKIGSNGTTSGTKKDFHSVSPSWLIAIFPFEEPASSYNKDIKDAMNTVSPIVIQNDCISVSVSRPKNSMVKSASFTLKITDIYYQHAVAAGDWVMIWMGDHQEDIDRIAAVLKGANANTKADNSGKDAKNKYSIGSLNDWESGLKFVGRVTDIGASEEVSMSGQSILAQSIQAQSFVELTTSLYYTDLQRVSLQSLVETTPSGVNASTYSALRGKLIESQVYEEAIRDALGHASQNYFEMFALGSAQTPDQIISNLIVLTMGIPNGKNKFNKVALGTPNDAIKIPKIVAKCLGRENKQYLWELYSVYLGRQKYSNRGKTPWEIISPDLDETKIDYANPRDNVFLYSPYRLKGVVPFIPPSWNNQSIYSVWNQYLHPLLNEMYTCLKINRFGQILPSIVVREQPWSTGLFNYLRSGQSMKPVPMSQGTNLVDKQEIGQREDGIPLKKVVLKNTEATLTENQTRTFFHNLPRWVIDESLISVVDTYMDEADRVNFVQVFSKFPGGELLQGDVQSIQNVQRQSSFGNFLIDKIDIQRNGLRAVIAESDHDAVIKTGGQNASIKSPILTGDNYFLRARFIGNKKVEYTLGNHNLVIRSGGSRSWRNNNSGNIRMSDFAIAHGAIGQEGDFAIFQTAEQGFEAIQKLLQTQNYKNLTINQAIARYAPTVENNVTAYQASVKKNSGLNMATKISELDDIQLYNLSTAIKKHEGYDEGDETEIEASNAQDFQQKVLETTDDQSNANGTSAPYWAKILADWKFNGHLKLRGSIRMAGIKEPICEGDNVEIKGMLYHIDAINFSASISPTGQKQFNTTLSVSNGLVVQNLNEKQAPLYAIHLSHDPSKLDVRGYTEIQNRIVDETRNRATGEKR